MIKSNVFFNLPKDEQVALFEKASEQYSMNITVIEKDFWLCWLLEKLFQLPMSMAFKGGTSLSKVFGLIKRFSEDVDITIDYRNFIEDLDLSILSRSQLKKISNQLKEQLQAYVQNEVYPYLENLAKNTFPNDSFEINLSEDCEKIRFHYPSVLNDELIYLRDHVLLEFGIRNDVDPNEPHVITPYVSNISQPHVIFPKAPVDTLSPIRTFWEKATLIHVECNRGRLKQTPERLSRHWYDLYSLANSWVGRDALSRLDILLSVIDHKKAFFNSSYANYDNCLNGNFKLCPDRPSLEGLQADYNLMIEAGMFNELPPQLTDILQGFSLLEDRINSLITEEI